MNSENEYFKFGNATVVKFSKENEKKMNDITEMCFNNLKKNIEKENSKAEITITKKNKKKKKKYIGLLSILQESNND